MEVLVGRGGEKRFERTDTTSIVLALQKEGKEGKGEG